MHAGFAVDGTLRVRGKPQLNRTYAMKDIKRSCQERAEGKGLAHASTLNGWEQVAVLLLALFAADVTLALRVTRL